MCHNVEQPGQVSQTMNQRADAAVPKALPPRWRRAALLGSLWAANEIVLGSFLHNINFPLTGTLLAAIGVTLLVAGLRLWQDTGIVWRAGLICALLKSLSPSAVILGPMIGILTEAFLLFLLVTLMRRHTAGYVIGGMLVTMTPMIQKLIGILLVYGNDAARLYEALFDFVAGAVGLRFIDPAGALAVFIALNALPGAVAAVAGLRVARRARELPPPSIAISSEAPVSGLDASTVSSTYSLLFLAVHFFLLVAGLLYLGRIPLPVGALLVAVYLLVTLKHHPSLRTRFARPRLWVEFGVVALLAGLLLGSLAPEGKGTWWTGLLSGLHMTIRATLVVSAFSAISIELRNPRVVRWFLRRGLGTLSAALDAAFHALPAMISTLGEQRNVLRHPIASLSRMLAHVLVHAQENPTTTPSPPRVFILSGEQGTGKTTLLAALIKEMRKEGIVVGGIRAPVVYVQGKRVGYDIEDIPTDTITPLCRVAEEPSSHDAGRFRFLPDGLSAGRRALLRDPEHTPEVLIVDEVGPLELDGKGWADQLETVLHSFAGAIILVVRSGMVAEVLDRWQIHPAAIWNIPAPFDSLMASYRDTLPSKDGSMSGIPQSGIAPEHTKACRTSEIP
jgi:nucleoside-triphosphatase THEP1